MTPKYLKTDHKHATREANNHVIANKQDSKTQLSKYL